MSLTSEALEQFVRDLGARPELWQPHVRPDAHARAYTEIWSDDAVNAYLICWGTDSDTGFHDHDASAASVTVLEGAIVDERLCLSAPGERRTHRAGTTFNIAPTAIHRVTAPGASAITIHAYSPPLTRTGTYAVTADGRLERMAQSAETELRAATKGALELRT